MYHPPPPKEPSGCIQTIVITRMILQILFIPIMLILGGIVGVLLFIDAVSISPFLGLGVLLLGGGVMVAVAKWEWRRVGKDIPPDEDFNRR